jgi:hypothetical protein
MNKAIKASRIHWASLTLHKYFGDYTHEVYKVLENFEVGEHNLNPCMAFSTIYFGQRIQETELSKIEDGSYFIYEAYKILLTIDIEDEEIVQSITQQVDEEYRQELKCLIKFHREDILGIK